MAIRDEFKSHELNETGINKAEIIKQMFSDLLTDLESLVPPGRPRALVATKLEEAAMFAVRGMAMAPENQKS